jgi:hypothetical protein
MEIWRVLYQWLHFDEEQDQDPLLSEKSDPNPPSEKIYPDQHYSDTDPQPWE